MFDLEESVAEWRWEMMAAGIKAPVPLDELELHLRDDVEEQMRASAEAQAAFEAAVRRIGRASEIEREFKRACGAPWSARLWWLWLWIGSFGLFQTVILNLVGPYVFHRRSSAFFSHKWWADWFPSYVVWITLTLVGCAIGFTHWRSKRRATLE
jgi:hypothetical protein